MILCPLQSAGAAKEEKDKGKKGKKGKGKDEPVKRPPPQKPPQKQRPAEAAAMRPEQASGGRDGEERAEEGGAAEQEEKVRRTFIDAPLCRVVQLCSWWISNLVTFQDDDADQDNPGAEVGVAIGLLQSRWYRGGGAVSQVDAGRVGQVQFCCVLPGSREPAHLPVRSASSRRRAAVRCASVRAVHRPVQLQVRDGSSLCKVSQCRGPSTNSFHLLSPSTGTKWNWHLAPKRRAKVKRAEIWLRIFKQKKKKEKAVLQVYAFKLRLFLSAARTAVLSFMKAKETTARERDLYRSVKVSD